MGGWTLCGWAAALMMLAMSIDGARAAPLQLRGEVETRCVGRFLIDVPANTVLSSTYVYARKKVDTAFSVSRDAFELAVSQRESELAAARHREGGDLLVSVARIDRNAVLITSWRSASSRVGHRQELYVFEPDHGVQYVFSGDSDAGRLPLAVERNRELRARISYRNPSSVPDKAGFCIESGFIVDNRINSEEMTIGMRPRTYPGVRMTLMSYVTGKPDRPLLQRAGNVPPAYAAAEMRMRKLRRGERDIGPIQGQEILAHAKEDGKQAYAFLWESQGQAESLQSPFLSFQLMTEETEGKGFSDDAQALDLWDQVLGSLRLRPGAI